MQDVVDTGEFQGKLGTNIVIIVTFQQLWGLGRERCEVGKYNKKYIIRDFPE